MKTNKKRRTIAISLLAGSVVLILLAALFVFFYGPKWLDQKRDLAAPPSILVRSPQAGDTVSPDSALLMQVIVSGTNPIAHVEVWLDGEVAVTHFPETQDQTTVYDSFDLQISLGTHMVFFRAVDNAGLVGQSAPIPIAGQFPPGAGETTNVSAEEGQSLQDIANTQGADPGLLQNLNPGLGGGGLPAGTNVVVPVPPNQNNGNQPGGPVSLPTTPLPDAPPAGIPALSPANIPVIDFTPFIPGLLANLPSAPSHLQAGFENCIIRLMWNDNATNEDHFKVWMQALGGPPLNIKTLEARTGTGQTWFEFESPSFGIYSFWVEAVNGLGRQPSEIAWAAVNDASCGEGVASQLEIEALGMSGFGSNWERMYCYLSIEGFPEKRIPQDDSQFLQKDTFGGADIHKWIGGKNRLLTKIPADEVLTLEGDCWGWLGDNPVSMGDFNVTIPKEQWDNRVLQIHSTNYVIDYRIRPFGSTQAQGAYQYLDYDLPQPHNLRIQVATGNNPAESARHAKKPVVRWDWDGDLADITGFTLYADGSVVDWNVIHGAITQWDPALGGQALSPILPTSCGGVYQFQVAANSEHARSRLSDPLEYIQSPCERYAEIHFESFSFSSIDDGETGACDEPELELQVWLPSRQLKTILGEVSLDCNREYPFTGLIDNPQIIPIDDTMTRLALWVWFYDTDYFVITWDRDLICAHYNEIQIPASDLEWAVFDQDFQAQCPSNVWSSAGFDGQGTIKYRIRGFLGPE